MRLGIRDLLMIMSICTVHLGLLGLYCDDATDLAPQRSEDWLCLIPGGFVLGSILLVITRYTKNAVAVWKRSGNWAVAWMSLLVIHVGLIGRLMTGALDTDLVLYSHQALMIAIILVLGYATIIVSEQGVWAECCLWPWEELGASVGWKDGWFLYVSSRYPGIRFALRIPIAESKARRLTAILAAKQGTETHPPTDAGQRG